jgi:hypothetical protein
MRQQLDGKQQEGAMNDTATQPEMDGTAAERQLARLIGLAMGGSFILVMVFYAMVL